MKIKDNVALFLVVGAGILLAVKLRMFPKKPVNFGGAVLRADGGWISPKGKVVGWIDGAGPGV